ncbi:hypothetical protein DFH08DRAFT_818251 [Mycena albidolilacea]|uniref:Uncharacterized protein n=1 Tax=Mycena albidolilacea TaxID=1033008 RepID=A0AAD6ZGV8_9AGAR|nr:hypothetical protein DFH08DRAFT_818251 [Mycena albidolilacea]
MGSSISSIINKQQGDLKAQAKDQLNVLLTMADLNALIPVDKILVMNYNSLPDNIETVITNTGKVFVSGNILNRLTAVLGAGLDVVFGNVAANQAECTTYSITCGDLGIIMHINISTFCYTFSSPGLTQVTNNIVSVTYMVSSINSSKLDRDTIQDIIQVCYGRVVPQDQLLTIYQQIITAFNGNNVMQIDMLMQAVGMKALLLLGSDTSVQHLSAMDLEKF